MICKNAHGTNYFFQKPSFFIMLDSYKQSQHFFPETMNQLAIVYSSGLENVNRCPMIHNNGNSMILQIFKSVAPTNGQDN